MSNSAERLKVHRRSLRLEGSEYTILSPRPSEPARFATNRYHEAWHIVSDQGGAQLLARLCWAMAFQQKDRTLVLIDAPLLVPNPFDAEPSAPIVITNRELEPLRGDALLALRTMLPLDTPSLGTVVLQTRGLDLALDDEAAFLRRDEQQTGRTDQQRRWIDGTNGLAVLDAPPAVLRGWGVAFSNLAKQVPPAHAWKSYLDSPQDAPEVQVISDFGQHVEAAIAARKGLFPITGDEALTEDERARIWSARRAAS